MINKEICKKCIGTREWLTWRWDGDFVYCPYSIKPYGINEIFEHCKYYLEQTVAEENTEKINDK